MYRRFTPQSRSSRNMPQSTRSILTRLLRNSQTIARQPVQTSPRSAPRPATTAPRKSKTDDNPINDIHNAFTNLLNNQNFILASLFAFFIVWTHRTGFSAGPLGKLFEKNKSNPFLTWLNNTHDSAFSMLVYLPAWFAVPANRRYYVLAAAALFVLALGNTDYFQHLLITVCVILYFKVKRPVTKYCLIFFFVFLVYFEHLDFLKSKSSTTATPPTTKPKTYG